MVRAIIFDLDGTLIDSLPDIASALGYAMVELGLVPPGRELVRAWIGGGARNLVAQAVAPDLVDSVYARFQLHYAARPCAESRLYAGMPAVLDQLTIPLAVLTNKPHALAVRICEQLLAPWPFRSFTGHQDGVPLKPDPTAALRIARELDVPPAACALVGDAGSDVATARAAGMRAIAVSWGYRPREDLAGAERIVDAPAGLLTLLGE
jgi:phosphoglycolate phosphatase